MLEADGIMHDEVKRSMKKEYIRRAKKTLSSKSNGSVKKTINSWAVSLVREGSRGILNWTKSELAELDHPRKLSTIHGALHPRSNVSRLYLPRRQGGRGLISVEDAINTEERNANVYISQVQERLLKAAWKRNNVDEIETGKDEEEKN